MLERANELRAGSTRARTWEIGTFRELLPVLEPGLVTRASTLPRSVRLRTLRRLSNSLNRVAHALEQPKTEGLDENYGQRVRRRPAYSN